MGAKGVFAVLIFLFLLFPTLIFSQSYVDAYIRSGFKHGELKQYEEAIKSCEEAAKIKPDSFLAYQCLCLFNFVSHQYESSVSQCQKAIHLRPDSYEDHLRLQISYSLLEKHEEAIRIGGELIKLRPDDYAGYLNMGISYVGLKEYQKALAVLKKAVELKPDDYLIHNYLGIAYKGLGEYEEAIAVLNKAIKLNPDEVFLYYDLGSVYRDLKQYDKAIEVYQQLIKRKLDDSYTYVSLGNLYSDKKEYENAIQSYERALQLRPNNAPIYSLIGHSYTELKKFDKAVIAFQRTLSIEPSDYFTLSSLGYAYSKLEKYEEVINILNQAIKLKPDYYIPYVHLGFVYLVLKDYAKSLEAYKKVIALKPDECQVHGFIGMLYNNLQQNNEAIDAYQAAIQCNPNDYKAYVDLGFLYLKLGNYERTIALLEKALMINPDYDSGLLEIGLTYSFKGNYQEALKAYERVIDLCKKRNDIRCEAQALFGKGVLYYLYGQDIYAHDNLNKALSLFRKSNNKIGEINALETIAAFYINSNNKDMALECFNKALSLSEELHDKGLIIKYLGLTALISSGEDERIRFAQKAIDIAEKEGFTSHANTYNAYLVFAIKYYEAKNYEKLSVYANKLHSIAQNANDRFLILQHSLLSGIATANLGSIADAINDLKKAYRIASEVNSYKAKQIASYELAKIAKKLGNLPEAKDYYLESIKSIEQIRKGSQSLSFKISIAENAGAVYNETIDLFIQLEDFENAFNYAEMSRGRAFLDIIGNGLINLSLQNKELIVKEKFLQTKIFSLEEYINKIMRHGDDKSDPRLIILKKELEAIQSEYSLLLDNIKKDYPELSSFLMVTSLTLKEIQATLDPDVTLLEYFVTPEKTFLWVLDKLSFKFIELPIKSAELESKVNTYRDKIATLQTDYEQYARDLYDLLIKPAKPYIRTTKLGIVPHSILHYLPFQALLKLEEEQTKLKRHFLIEDYDIFYITSASILKLVYEKRKVSTDKILAFGNPYLEDGSCELPYAEEEVKKIKETFPKTDIYLGKDATKEKAKNLSSDYNVIHFASHAEMDTEQPLSSCIMLAKEKGDDGRLTVQEIFNMSLSNSSMVILSACETALGKIKSGDELIGLTRGFIYAGTPTIVATLWSVNDQSTAELMNNFYKNLKYYSKAGALRLAQVEMIQGKTGQGIVRNAGHIIKSRKGKINYQLPSKVEGSHPFFWAPFILVGDWK